MALVIWFIFVGVGSICAQTETDILYKKHTFELGPEISYRTYKEPDVVRERGTMYGLVASYTYHNKIMLKAEATGSIGWYHYSGSGQIDNIRDIRGLGGYDFSVLKSSILTPYIGIGYRHLNDDFAGNTSAIYGLVERYSTNIYSPIGIGFITGLGNDWSIGGTGEYDLFWSGKQISYIPVTGSNNAYNQVGNSQKNGYGLRGSITLEKKYKKVIFELGPSIRYWNIKKSETNGIAIGFPWAPRSNSTEVGVKLAVKF